MRIVTSEAQLAGQADDGERQIARQATVGFIHEAKSTEQE